MNVLNLGGLSTALDANIQRLDSIITLWQSAILISERLKRKTLTLQVVRAWFDCELVCLGYAAIICVIVLMQTTI